MALRRNSAPMSARCWRRGTSGGRIWITRVGRKRLKKLRRQRRRLLEAGQLKFVSARELEAMPRALADFVALETHGWKGRAGSAVSAAR